MEWKGKWSDNSDEWTPELKKELELISGDDGTFWINISDFRKYYEGVTYIDQYTISICIF